MTILDYNLVLLGPLTLRQFNETNNFILLPNLVKLASRRSLQPHEPEMLSNYVLNTLSADVSRGFESLVGSYFLAIIQK